MFDRYGSVFKTMTTTLQISALERTAAALGHVARRWLDRDDLWRQEAVIALQVSTGFSRKMVEEALENAFEELTEEKILAHAAQEPAYARSSGAFNPVLHILAGNVFTSWLPGAVTTLLLGADCHLKSSS